jgi:hypothetical protein
MTCRTPSRSVRDAPTAAIASAPVRVSAGEDEGLRELPNHEALDEMDRTVALPGSVVVEARENEPFAVGASNPPGGHDLVTVRHDPPRDREML